MESYSVEKKIGDEYDDDRNNEWKKSESENLEWKCDDPENRSEEKIDDRENDSKNNGAYISIL